jgi:hypothetical protein
MAEANWSVAEAEALFAGFILRDPENHASLKG